MTEASLLTLYNASVPPSYGVREEAFCGLTDNGTLFCHEEDGKTVGFALLRQSSLTLLCVLPPYRCRGIGGALLARAEACARKNGQRLILGYGSDYVLQGVPTENHAHHFFRSHGFRQTGYTYDLLLPLTTGRFPLPDGVTMELRAVDGKILAAVAGVEKSWLGVYETTDEDVLLATVQGRIAGFCIPAAWHRFPGTRQRGSIGCVGVLPELRGRGIGLAMVAYAGEYLRENGCTEAEILHTAIPEWYGKLGAVPFHCLWMGEKLL